MANNYTNILVIGAGLTGLSAAYHLKRDHILLEKESKAGGMASSEYVRGFLFDKTGHLLHFRTEFAKNLVRRLCGSRGLSRHKRSSWVFSKGTYTRYPFQVNTYKLPPLIIKDCLVKMAEAQIALSETRNPHNFRDWILNNFGEGVARHFMFPYNRKFWRTPLCDMDTDWVDNLIPTTTLEEAVKGAVSDFRKSFGYNRVFYYPENGGIQKLTDSFSLRAKNNLHFKQKVVKIEPKEKIATLSDGRTFRFDKIISTMPLPELGKIIKGLPADIKAKMNGLKYVSVFNINLGVDRQNISDKHWIYFPEEKYIFYRVGFMSNFSKDAAPKNGSSIYVEISYTKESPLKYGRKALRSRVIKNLKNAGILKNNDKIVASKSYDIKYAYPIHDTERKRLVCDIKKFLRDRNIYSVGRYGGWQYMTMEECMLEGKLTAETINSL
ncbi:protoporphyrinogen/coproporphyrinogen oxidase [Candidatus Omnitrophota bacterium]